ncbi:MAG: HPP family protein [Rhizobiales bacterium]|nr:HPP family protein [Hyphomicrobiales bacterium]
MKRLRSVHLYFEKNPWILMIISAVGGALAIALMELLSARTTYPLFAIPFATSIVLVMGSPEAEPAQPRALVGGHLIASIVGFAIVQLTGPSPWMAAFAVGLAMIAMHLTRTFHPPAGIDPLLIVVNDMTWNFLLVPVAAGAVILAIFAYIWHNITRPGSWPRRWW